MPLSINFGKNLFIIYQTEIGINMTTAINMFIKKVIREQRIPFELSLNKPNLETLQAIQESEDILNGIKKVKSFNSVEELFEDLNK